MDEDRKVRFLIAPTLSIGSFVLAIIADTTRSMSDFVPGFKINSEDVGDWFPIAATGGFTLLCLGFLLDSTGEVVLRLIDGVLQRYSGICSLGGKSRSKSQYPGGGIKRDTLTAIYKILKVNRGNGASDFYATEFFEHTTLIHDHEEVHKWKLRRWNSFIVHVNSFIGLILSGALVLYCGMSTWGWFIPVCVAVVIVALGAFFAWVNTMRMISFQLQVIQANLPTAPSPLEEA